MKALGVATVIFGLLATPLCAEPLKTVTFNGNIFDVPATPGPQVQQTSVKPKTSHHVKKRVQN